MFLDAACTRWAQMRRAFPDHAAGFVRGAEALMHADHLEEAEALAAEAVARFPDHPRGHLHRIELATRRRGSPVRIEDGEAVTSTRQET